jgi:hypothetical protein
MTGRGAAVQTEGDGADIENVPGKGPEPKGRSVPKLGPRQGKMTIFSRLRPRQKDRLVSRYGRDAPRCCLAQAKRATGAGVLRLPPECRRQEARRDLAAHLAPVPTTAPTFGVDVDWSPGLMRRHEMPAAGD